MQATTARRNQTTRSDGVQPLDLTPTNREAEEAFLGAVLTDPSAVALVRGTVSAEDFWQPSYGAAWQAMLDLAEQGTAIDIITLTERLEAQGYGEGVATGLIKFIAETPTSVHVQSYAQIIKDLAMRRRLIDLAAQLSRRAYDEERDVDDVLNETLSDVVGVVKHKTGLIQNTRDVVRGAIERVLWRQEHPGELWGLSTSLPGLDREMDGLPNGLTVLAGITKHGKTALALQIAQHHAQAGRHVGLFALEMTAQSLVMRLACSRADVDKNKQKRGRLNSDDLKRLNQAFAEIESEPWHMVYKPGIRAADIYSEVARLKMMGRCDLVVVDYLQLMDHGDEQRRDLAIANTTRLLHNMGIEFEIPVLCLAQFNRAVHSRDGQIPSLSDLKDSGSIEQDAALVLFIHRPEMIYKSRLQPVPEEERNIAYIIVAANREGDIGVHKCYWDGPRQQVRELAERVNANEDYYFGGGA